MRGCSSVAPCGPDGARAVGQPEKPTATDSTQNPTSAPGLPHRRQLLRNRVFCLGLHSETLL